MTQEEKELLLKDLSGRLLYNVVVQYTAGDGSTTIDCHIDCISIRSQCVGIIDAPRKPFVWRNISSIKPYLRPMTSMTEEEDKEFWKIVDNYGSDTDAFDGFELGDDVDWLNAHHFDYRGLIEKGLALEAPAGMYNEKNEKDKPEQMPGTIEDAISILDAIVSDEDKEYILKNGSISVHNSLGRWIRNEWGLWGESDLKKVMLDKGIEHPDDMSDYIIQRFIEHIKK